MEGSGESSAERLLSVKGMQRVPSRELQLFILRDFLDERECVALIERIDAERRPSTRANSDGQPDFRTSENCDLDHDDCPPRRDWRRTTCVWAYASRVAGSKRIRRPI